MARRGPGDLRRGPVRGHARRRSEPRRSPPTAAGRAGEPMTYWESHQSTLLPRRLRAGRAGLAALGPLDRVDCALRLYVARNAHRVARPADLVDAPSRRCSPTPPPCSPATASDVGRPRVRAMRHGDRDRRGGSAGRAQGGRGARRVPRPPSTPATSALNAFVHARPRPGPHRGRRGRRGGGRGATTPARSPACPSA